MIKPRRYKHLEALQLFSTKIASFDVNVDGTNSCLISSYDIPRRVYSRYTLLSNRQYCDMQILIFLLKKHFLPERRRNFPEVLINI